ncbi:hypothetical protein X777_13222 [Ooceraea biroi]|uniref:Uncharacterized protein n=1 Tax=Ooceraea biroi TaxID=2015173 RepID=A0A026VXQ6_OOCBI|nr:hypothetical protein X777_13222 [Ooceraea biroi]
MFSERMDMKMEWSGQTKTETWTETDGEQKVEAKQQKEEKERRGVNEKLRYMGCTESPGLFEPLFFIGSSRSINTDIAWAYKERIMRYQTSAESQ